MTEKQHAARAVNPNLFESQATGERQAQYNVSKMKTLSTRSPVALEPPLLAQDDSCNARNLSKASTA